MTAAALPKLLLTCAAGSPEEPRTWSGTPANILRSLRLQGQLDVIPHASPLAGRAKLWSGRADRALRLEHRYIHGPVRREWQAIGASKAADENECFAALHMGTYDLPLWTNPSIPRFLFVDNSYDVWERQAREAQVLSPRQRRWYRKLEAQSLKHVRHVFTVGEHVADNFVDVWGIPRDKVTAVGSGLGAIKPYTGPKDYAAGRLLIVAKIRPHEKGLPLLLEAFSLARRARPELTLTVIGGEKLPEVAACEGARGTGWITAEELQAIFEQSSLFVMPATYEPWGLSYLEALACRTPVMGLARNAMPEISGNGEYGFMLPQPDVKALADGILSALADPARLARMGEAGQKHVLERYRWEHVAKVMSETILRESPTA